MSTVMMYLTFSVKVTLSFRRIHLPPAQLEYNKTRLQISTVTTCADTDNNDYTYFVSV